LSPRALKLKNSGHVSRRSAGSRARAISSPDRCLTRASSAFSRFRRQGRRVLCARRADHRRRFAWSWLAFGYHFPTFGNLPGQESQTEADRSVPREVGGGHARNRTGVQGFAVLCVTTPPRGRPFRRRADVEWSGAYNKPGSTLQLAFVPLLKECDRTLEIGILPAAALHFFRV
jgi:hypothetical protein